MVALSARSILTLALTVAIALQGNLQLGISADAEPGALHLGVSDGVLGDVGPSNDPAPASAQARSALHELQERMTDRWQRLDQACDPNAVFALLYLVTTEVVVDHIERGHFDDNEHVAWWTIEFATRYEQAIDAWEEDRPGDVPGPWLEAFHQARNGNTSVAEDALLGINAHVNFDLGNSAHAMDLVAEHRKADFDRINDALAAASEPASEALATHYDPSMDDGAGEAPTLLLLFEWREEGWNHAQALTNAQDGALEDQVRSSMEAHATAKAKTLVAPKLDPPGDERLAYCQAQNAA